MDLENKVTELKEECDSVKNILAECLALLEQSDMCNDNLITVAKTFLDQEVIEDDVREELDFDFLDYWDSMDTYTDNDIDLTNRNSVYGL